MELSTFHLPALLSGNRFCCSCKQPSIPASAKEYVTQCPEDYYAFKDLSIDQLKEKDFFCTDCGTQIPKNETDMILSRGGRVRDCASCHRDSMAEVKSSRRLALIESLRLLPTQ